MVVDLQSKIRSKSNMMRGTRGRMKAGNRLENSGTNMAGMCLYVLFLVHLCILQIRAPDCTPMNHDGQPTDLVCRSCIYECKGGGINVFNVYCQMTYDGCKDKVLITTPDMDQVYISKLHNYICIRVLEFVQNTNMSMYIVKSNDKIVTYIIEFPHFPSTVANTMNNGDVPGAITTLSHIYNEFSVYEIYDIYVTTDDVYTPCAGINSMIYLQDYRNVHLAVNGPEKQRTIRMPHEDGRVKDDASHFYLNCREVYVGYGMSSDLHLRLLRQPSLATGSNTEYILCFVRDYFRGMVITHDPQFCNMFYEVGEPAIIFYYSEHSYECVSHITSGKGTENRFGNIYMSGTVVCQCMRAGITSHSQVYCRQCIMCDLLILRALSTPYAENYDSEHPCKCVRYVIIINSHIRITCITGPMEIYIPDTRYCAHTDDHVFILYVSISMQICCKTNNVKGLRWPDVGLPHILRYALLTTRHSIRQQKPYARILITDKPNPNATPIRTLGDDSLGSRRIWRHGVSASGRKVDRLCRMSRHRGAMLTQCVYYLHPSPCRGMPYCGYEHIYMNLRMCNNSGGEEVESTLFQRSVGYLKNPIVLKCLSTGRDSVFDTHVYASISHYMRKPSMSSYVGCENYASRHKGQILSMCAHPKCPNLYYDVAYFGYECTYVKLCMSTISYYIMAENTLSEHSWRYLSYYFGPKYRSTVCGMVFDAYTGIHLCMYNLHTICYIRNANSDRSKYVWDKILSQKCQEKLGN